MELKIQKYHWNDFLVFCKTGKKLSDTKDFRSIFICPSLLREEKSKLQSSYKGTFWCKFLNFECPELLRSSLNYYIPFILRSSCFFISTRLSYIILFFLQNMKKIVRHYFDFHLYLSREKKSKLQTSYYKVSIISTVSIKRTV